jgi:hypothetical protein
MDRLLHRPDMTRKKRSRPGLLTLRAAFVIVLSVTASCLIGDLTWHAQRNAAEALLAGITAFPAATTFINWMIA